MRIKAYFANLVAAIVGSDVKGEIRRQVREVSGQTIEEIVRKHITPEQLSEDLQGVVDQLMVSSGFKSDVQEAFVLAALEAKIPRYEPVLVIGIPLADYPLRSRAPAEFDSYNAKHELEDPIATVSVYSNKRTGGEAYVHALHDLMRQARAMGGNVIALQEVTYPGWISNHCLMVGQVYFNPNLRNRVDAPTSNTGKK